MRRLLDDAVKRVVKEAYISDVFPDFLIYSVWDKSTHANSLFKRDYSLTEEGQVVLGETASPVEMQTKYVLQDGSFLNATETVDNYRTEGAANDPATQRRREMLLSIRAKITEATKKIYELMKKMEDRKLSKEQYQKMGTSLREMQKDLQKHKQSYLDAMKLVDESDKFNPVRKSGVDSNLQALATELRKSGVNDLEGLIHRIRSL
jgi:hypothetical protein